MRPRKVSRRSIGRNDVSTSHSRTWAVHGLFVLVFPYTFNRLEMVSSRIVGVAAFGLVAYQALSYRVNYIGEEGFVYTGPVTVMVEPYPRYSCST